jgi:hypothetical protein
MNFMLILGLPALLPRNVVSTMLIGATMSPPHALIILTGSSEFRSAPDSRDIRAAHQVTRRAK